MEPRLWIHCIVSLVLLGLSGPVRGDEDLMDVVDRWRHGRPELRAGVPHSTWTFDRGAAFRLSSTCLEDLAEMGVRARPLTWSPTPAPQPVIVDEVPGGVSFHKRRAGAPLVVACAMARRLPRWAALLRRRGITRVEVLSALRREPQISYHHLGLALDLTRFWEEGGRELNVETDWKPRPGARTCATRDPDDRLQGLVCAMADARIFSTVITPSYGRGHGDHFHVDVRPGEAWRFLR